MIEPAPAGVDYRLRAGTPLHRIHRDRRGSVAFFDTSEHGRFNLTDIAGRGTCYLALEALGAYIETLGRILTRSRDDIDGRRHSIVTVNRDLRLFNLASPTARGAYRQAGLDLTATVAAGDSYATSQRLARLAHGDGFDGVLYAARHDPSHAQVCVALFGPAGPQDPAAVFDSTTTTTISDGLITEAQSTYGLIVVPFPAL